MLAASSLVDDGGAHNGSFVGGARVHGHRRLRNGDTILLGRTSLAFCSPTGSEQRTTTSRSPAVPRVTDAQLRVLTALCRPCVARAFAVPASNRQIAEELAIGLETVKTHMSALFEAFGLGPLPQHQKRATLAQQALESGLVTAAP